MIIPKNVAKAVGAKTARACDSCLLFRARWYCPADDAFLCQRCDSSVHSANQLASRHERVKLETASNKKTESNTCSSPPWLKGFTRKPRTPRHHKPKNDENIVNPLPLVPEIGVEEGSIDENDQEQLVYRVPVYDPFDAELCNAPNERIGASMGSELNENFDMINGFLPSDLDLEEFAADVESLLGKGLDEDLCGIESLGLLDCKEEDDYIDTCVGGGRVKVEDEEVGACLDSHLDLGLDGTRETMDWNFDYQSPVTEQAERRKILLRLDYDEVISAWASKGSPWMTGIKPELNPDDGWPDFMGTCPVGTNHLYGGPGGRMGGGGDGEREARVLRYREKRRTRLFSKKIRYEVRKLNAEKRPRMKGRFVKRTSCGGGPAFPYLTNKT